jgi:hypothetical protein
MDKHMEKERNIEALREGYQETEATVSTKKRSGRAFRAWMYAAIAVMLIMSATMGSAWAYFTSYAKAKGGVTLKLGHEEHIDEEFDNWEKVIDLTSTADSNPVYLRMRAYSAEYPVTYENNANWTKDGDWMYYNNALQPGKKLSDSGDELLVQINNVPESDNPELKDGKTFNVIVVYESTEVQYDEQGNMIPATAADWSKKVDTNRRSSTLGGE